MSRPVFASADFFHKETQADRTLQNEGENKELQLEKKIYVHETKYISYL